MEYHVGMAITGLTLDPDQVNDATLPAWLRSIADFVSQAAASGKTVTVTADELTFTPEQVAARTGIHRSTISRKIKSGEIYALKVGNRNRVPYSELRRFQEGILDNMVSAVMPEIEAELFGEE